MTLLQTARKMSYSFALCCGGCLFTPHAASEPRHAVPRNPLSSGASGTHGGHGFGLGSVQGTAVSAADGLPSEVPPICWRCRSRRGCALAGVAARLWLGASVVGEACRCCGRDVVGIAAGQAPRRCGAARRRRRSPGPAESTAAGLASVLWRSPPSRRRRVAPPGGTAFAPLRRSGSAGAGHVMRSGTEIRASAADTPTRTYQRCTQDRSGGSRLPEATTPPPRRALAARRDRRTRTGQVPGRARAT
jgi:hypothetical protein